MEKIKWDLVSKFKEIHKKGYIKGVNNSTNSVGLTFEKELGKKPDSSYLPDYNGIEIKCTTRFSRFPISLFSKSFDGPENYEMNRLLTTYGKKDIIYKDKRILIGDIFCNKTTLIYSNYFKLEVDRNEEKIFILVYDLKMKLIERTSYIDFSTLKSRISTKLSNVALVYASKKIINSIVNFRYYKMIIYKYTCFDNFLNMLESGEIYATISGRISRSGEKEGKQRNKNLVFKIEKDSINKLFTEDIVTDCDIKTSTFK